MYTCMYVQPTADRVAQNLEMDSREFQFSIRHTRIPMRFMISIICYVDRVAQYLEIISQNCQFSTKRSRIPMGFIIYFLVQIVNPIGRILVC